MSTGPDRPQPDAPDPLPESGGVDRGYRVEARLARPRDRRPLFVAIVTAGVLVGGIVVAALRIEVPGLAANATPGPFASQTRLAMPTRLPAVSRPHEPAPPIAPFPVLSDGLRWLDAEQGVVSGPPFTGAPGWIFAGSDGGAWCLCLYSPSAASGVVERATVVRYDPAGAEASRTVIGDIGSTMSGEDAVQIDVARTPDGAAMYLASTIRDLAGWTVRLDRIGLGKTPKLERTLQLGRIDRSPDGTIAFGPVVRVSPDGAIVRVAVPYLDRGRIGTTSPTEESVWLVGTTDPVGGIDVPAMAATRAPVAIERRPLVDADCGDEAWASATVYVRLCAEPSGVGLVPLAHLERLDGSHQDIQVGGPIGSDDLDWLVDSQAGIVYRWSPFGHVVARLDVATGTVLELAVDPTAGQITTERSRAPGRPRRALWAGLTSARDERKARLAGSSDGSLLYAIGLAVVPGDGPSGPLFASTGIWVFDATTLAVVDRSPAAAMYDQVGVTPDGRFVVTVGLEGMTADGALADWPLSVAIHDADTGVLVEQIGSLVGREGFLVDLLTPGPVP